MTELIKTIVTSLVDHPDKVVVAEKETGNAVTYQLSVHQDDLGKVIGKQGRIAKAIRSVLFAAASHENKRVQLEILE
ncbi:KH domain-containing protein [Sutcliffiella deserti]|uniref:KH domain-containing protein n=1 Tax=Sutcliffiella deserti TaxID=2875501 RepID=UPI001CC1760E|nr:KH domain-containing protein [Sutcliffiella deserti]